MLFLTIVYFFTRIPFLRGTPVFYDSFEYLNLVEKLDLSNFSQVIGSSHQPIHTFYFLTILVFKIIFFFIPTRSVLVFISLFFGYLTIITWYLLVKKFINNNIAIFSALLLLIFPYFFVVNTNILYESELLFFQIVSLYFAFDGSKKVDIKKILIAGILWGISQSIFIGSLLIAPIFFWQFLVSKKRRISYWLIFIFTLIGVVIPIIIDGLFLKSSLFLKYSSHLIDFVSGKGGLFILLLRIIRNIIFQTAAILSVSGGVVLFTSLLIIFLKNRKEFLTCLIWLIPPFFLMQYWHAGLFERLALFIVFPAALVISLVAREKLIRLLILFSIALTTVNFAVRQKNVLLMNRYIGGIKNSLNLKKIAIITSDYNRFIYWQNGLTTFVFNGLDENIPQAEKFIQQNLKKKQRVLIDSSGLRFPYYQFDGDFYHLLSLGKIGQSQAKEVLEKFDFKVFYTDKSNPEIYFFEITGVSTGKSAIQPKMFYSNDYFKINSNKPYSFDPLANLFYLLTSKKDPEYWWYEK